MMKKFLTLVLVIALGLTAIFASACDKTTEEYSSWKIVKKVSGDAALQNYAVFKLANASDSKITTKSCDIWANLSDFSTTVNIEIAFSSSSTMIGISEQNVSVTSDNLSENSGWVKLVEGANTKNYSYVEICVSDTINFNELVFKGTDGKLLSVSLVLTGVRPERGSNSKNEYTKDELDSAISVGTVTTSALNLIDEQSKFDM